ncbi:alpha-hydroxy acid oxidase [Bradyrhizobium sp. JR3.5]
MPRHLRRYLTLDDFEPQARRLLPKFLYGYISGGAETDVARSDNRRAFDEYGFVPRVLKDVSGRDQTTTLFGKTYASPFGIPPMGSSALCAYRGDIVLARAAAAANVPMILSASSLITLEDVRAANQQAWYQAYLAGLDERIEPLVDRVAAAGYVTFVVTADVPVPPNRENNIRNGFQVPLEITPRVFWDTITHPDWLLNTWARTVFNHGMPHFENMDAKQGPPVLSKNLMRNIGSRDQLAWKHVALIRKRWRGKLVVKGLISPEDARLAREHGCDGVMVSNHGGRQLDYTVSALRTLPEDRGAEGQHDRDDGRRHPPRHRRNQGARARCGLRLDRPPVPLRRGGRGRSRRLARDLAAARRDRPRPRAARHPQPERDHPGPGAEVLNSRIARRAHAERGDREQPGRDALGDREPRTCG